MPKWAHDRSGRGPFAALLILLGLVLSSGAAAGSASVQPGSAVRQSPVRSNAAILVARPAERGAVPGETPDPKSFAPPRSPAVVKTILWARPTAETGFGAGPAIRQPAHRSYRARAPPAL